MSFDPRTPAPELVNLAESHAQPCLRVIAEGPAIQSARLEPDLSELLAVTVDESTSNTLGLNIGTGWSLEVSAALQWLEMPVDRPQAQVHKVIMSHSSSSETSASILGQRATVTREQSLPRDYDLRRTGVDESRLGAGELNSYIVRGRDYDIPVHQVLGYGDPLQGDIWRDLAASLEAVGDDEALASLEAEEYRLLAQVESEPDRGLMIGDLGILYVLIPATDLPSLKTDRTLACVQSS